MQTPEAFVVGHNPVASANRAAQAQTQVKRSFYLLVPLVLFGAAYLWFFGQGPGRLRIAIASLSVSLLVWTGFLVWRIVTLRRARAALARVGAGEAFRIDHRGVAVAAALHQSAELIEWPDIATIKASGRPTGAGPDFVIEHRGGRFAIPLSFLDAMPGSIDSALRAYSGGRRGLELGELDSVFAQ